MPNIENVGRVLLSGTIEPKQAQIEGICRFNGADVYYVNTNYPNEHGGGWDVWTDADLQRVEQQQDDLRRIVAEREAQEARKQAQEQKQERQRLEAEDLYGFDEGKTPLQRGRILKVLMRRERFNGESMTRRDFIKQAAQEGREAFTRRFYGDKSDSYCIRNDDNTFFVVTKVEYDFFQYLKEA